jgi:hypothetical protein
MKFKKIKQDWKSGPFLLTHRPIYISESGKRSLTNFKLFNAVKIIALRSQDRQNINTGDTARCINYKTCNIRLQTRPDQSRRNRLREVEI